MSAGPDKAGEDERSTRWLRGSRVTPGTGLGRRQLRGHGHKKLVGWRRQAGSEGRQGIADTTVGPKNYSLSGVITYLSSHGDIGL